MKNFLDKKHIAALRPHVDIQRAWIISLVCCSVVAVVVVAYGVLLFASVIKNNPEDKEIVQIESISRQELGEATRAIEQRIQRFESIKAVPPVFSSPRR